jgi:hypothetical protein
MPVQPQNTPKTALVTVKKPFPPEGLKLPNLLSHLNPIQQMEF